MATESILLASSIFPNNNQQITDAYSEPCQTPKVDCLTKKANGFQPLTNFAKQPSYIFDRVLNMSLDYLSSFAVVLRRMDRNIEIYQTDYSIPSKLEFSPYSEVIHGVTTFKLTESQQRLKKNDQLFSLLFHFLYSNVPDSRQ